MSGGDRSTDGDGEGDRRDHVLDALETAIDESTRKIESGRIKDASKENARQGWHQTLAQLATSYRLLARDRDLDQLADEIDELQADLGGGSGGSDYRYR